MSVTGIQDAATSAEKMARALAVMFADVAAEHPDDARARINAQIAAQMIVNAELRAKLVRREEAEKRIDIVCEATAELDEQFDDGLLSTADVLARLDRIKSLDFDLWAALHRRNAWEQATEELRGMLPKEAADGT